MAEISWKEKIRPVLAGSNKYNPNNIALLESYVNYQAESDEYDFTANLTLMKLYQFQPTKANPTVVSQVLLKALTNLPTTDLIMLKAVLPINLREPNIQQILSLHALLESCQFREFWAEVRQDYMEVIQKIKDFEAAIRRYICGVIEISYQNISLALLKEYLGDPQGQILDELASLHKWDISSDNCHIRNQEDLIKPKKILAKIELDSVSGILGAVATR